MTDLVQDTCLLKKMLLVVTWLCKVKSDPSSPGAFGGINKLCSAIKDSTGRAPLPERVKNWLFKQDAYMFDANAAQHFPRNRGFIYDID